MRIALAPDPSAQVEEQTTRVLPGGLFRYLSRGGWVGAPWNVGCWPLAPCGKPLWVFPKKTLLESDLIWHAVFGKFECGEVLADLTSFQLIGHCLLCVARDRIVKFLMPARHVPKFPLIAGCPCLSRLLVWFVFPRV